MPKKKNYFHIAQFLSGTVLIIYHLVATYELIGQKSGHQPPRYTGRKQKKTDGVPTVYASLNDLESILQVLLVAQLARE
jgi:hypothetical protein